MNCHTPEASGTFYVAVDGTDVTGTLSTTASPGQTIEVDYYFSGVIGAKDSTGGIQWDVPTTPSLWPVSDEPTVKIARRFYAAWLKDDRTPPADALRTAVIGVRDETQHVAPRHWAAFGMYGPLR